jgi:Family of unknown function (DUF6279)
MKFLQAGRTLLSVVLFLSLAFAGCATTLFYNHADWLLTRQIDQYFDLTRSQRSFVSARLSALLEHHRQEALPQYEDVIRDAATRIQRGLTGDDVDWAFTQYDRLKIDLFGRFASDGADFLRLVRDSQLPHVKRKLRERLAGQEALLREPAQARTATRRDQMLKLVREWLGLLSREQERQIAELVTAFPDTVPLVYAHQLRRNDQLMAVLDLRMQTDSPTKLHAWLIDQETDRSYLEATREFRQHVKVLLLALDRTATPDQRRHVLAKLDDLARTVRALRAT